jgi:hypothetical protein
MPRAITCALLSAFRYEWAASIALACPGFEFVALRPSTIGLAGVPNPFGLVEDDRAEAVLVTKSFYEWLEDHHGDRVGECLRRLENVGPLVGLDGADEFALGFPPRAMERFRLVLKFQGLYRDRDLYNYLVGAWYPDAIWTEKSRPRRHRYRPSDLEKLQLSLPCFAVNFPAVRRKERAREAVAPTVGRPFSRPERITRNATEPLLRGLLRSAPIGGRRLDVHCVVALSHVQRLEAMRILEGFVGKRGITGAGDHLAGTGHIDAIPWYRAAVTGARVPADLAGELSAAAERYPSSRSGRIRFLFDLSRHKVAVAPTGFGEVTFRHGEVWQAGAALVCPDLSHVEMMFGPVDSRNAVFCRPDLSDLRTVIEGLLDDESARRRIATEGRRMLRDWERNWRVHVRGGIEQPIRDALGSH